MYVLSLYIRRFFLLGFIVFFTATGIHPARAGHIKLVVLGDSLSAGYQLPRGSGFPEQLQWRLNKDGVQVSVINAGVSGDTTSAGLARLDWAVPKDTSAVIVELGANDALRGIAPARTYKNLDTIISKLKKRNIKILLAGMEAPRNLGRPYVKAFGRIYLDLAKRHEIPLYPFFLEGVAMQRSLLLSDGMHPNEQGVAKIVAKILPYVERLIEQKP